MSVLKKHYDKYFVENLKIKICEKIGYMITSKPDCLILSELISKNGNGYISESTLYRIFFQSDKHVPYKNTLDLLCQFIGFSDSYLFLEYINDTKNTLYLNGLNTVVSSSNSLLYFCLNNNSYKSLYDFFESIDESSHEFKTNISIGLFDSIQKYDNQNAFFEYFAGQKFVREYFFEQGHDPKFRIKNYERGYLKYLEIAHKESDLSQFQDYVFGNSILFRYYYLTKNWRQAINIAKVIYSNETSIETYKADLYIFPFIRYTCYKLWYLEIINATQSEKEDYANYILELCRNIKPNYPPLEQKILFHTIAETLLNSNVSEDYHLKLKEIYQKEFEQLPSLIFSKYLKYSLPYFEPNGLIYYRP